MPKLTDTQLVILSAAARRQDAAVLPPPRQRSRRAEPKPSGAKPNARTTPTAVRPGTKPAVRRQHRKVADGGSAPAAANLKSASIAPGMGPIREWSGSSRGGSRADTARQIPASSRDGANPETGWCG